MVVAGTDWAGSCRKAGKHFSPAAAPPCQAQKKNGAGGIPRRSTIVKEWKSQLTFADQRRRRVDRRVGQIPAYAELQVMRGDILEGHRVVDGVDAIEGAEIAGQAVAHVEIAIGEFDGEVRRDLVGKTGMRGPGEIPLRRIVAEGETRQRGAAIVGNAL